MIELSGDAYLWVKALHAISVIFWMAALFMLPRFFAYHVEAAGAAEEAIWVERERRLMRIIMTPSMLAAWVFGLVMIAAQPSMLSGQGWLHAKLALVVALSGYHGFLVAQARMLSASEGIRATRTWRLLNEVPGVAIILVVILVIVKPY